MKVKSESEVAQSCPTLSDPMDCSLPGSSVHGIFQARGLEWGAIAFSDHEILLNNKKEQAIDTHNHQNQTPENSAEWKKASPQSLHSIHKTFLKWQSYENGKHNSACLGLRRRWRRRKVYVATEEQNEGSLCWKRSVSWECECKHSGGDIVLWLCGVLSYFILFIVLGPMACGILVPWLGIKLAPLALTAWSPNHWIASEVWFWKLFTLEETR